MYFSSCAHRSVKSFIFEATSLSSVDQLVTNPIFWAYGSARALTDSTRIPGFKSTGGTFFLFLFQISSFDLSRLKQLSALLEFTVAVAIFHLIFLSYLSY